jgi:hypothetical protein
MTKKKTTKKRAGKKATAKRNRQTAKYQLAGELSDKVQSPQQLLIRDAMQKLGPATAAEIAEQIEGQAEDEAGTSARGQFLLGGVEEARRREGSGVERSLRTVARLRWRAFFFPADFELDGEF